MAASRRCEAVLLGSASAGTSSCRAACRAAPAQLSGAAHACARVGRGAAGRAHTTAGQWPPAARSTPSMWQAASAALSSRSRLGAAHASTERRARASAAPSAPPRTSATANSQNAPHSVASQPSAAASRASAARAGASHGLPPCGQPSPSSPAAPQRVACSPSKGSTSQGHGARAPPSAPSMHARVECLSSQPGMLARPLQGPDKRRLQPSQARPGPHAFVALSVHAFAARAAVWRAARRRQQHMRSPDSALAHWHGVGKRAQRSASVRSACTTNGARPAHAGTSALQSTGLSPATSRPQAPCARTDARALGPGSQRRGAALP